MNKSKQDYEIEFSNILFENAIRFIDAGIGCINKGLSNYSNTMQAIVNLQIAMELALKSSIVSQYGIRKILKSNQNSLTDQELEELFRTNRLKIREYDDIKNFTKSNKCFYDFEKDKYEFMDNFQKYRNGILHSSYIFSKDENEKLERDILYTLTHILGVIISDDTDDENRTFMQEYLNSNEYANLLKNPVYQKEIYSFLNSEYDKLYMCPYCSTYTMTPDYKCALCFCCFNHPHLFKYTKCGYCGEKMMICDAGNIEHNNNMARGLCLSCKEDTVVYKCKKCGDFVNLELFDRKNCRENYCKYD